MGRQSPTTCDAPPGSLAASTIARRQLRQCSLPAHHLAVRPGVAAAPQHAVGVPPDDLAAPKVHPVVVALRVAHLRDTRCPQGFRHHLEDRA